VNTATDDLRRIADPASPEKDPPGRANAERLQQRARETIVNAMTIDVEDYFQVEAFASTVNRSEWERLPRRVERITERLLDILAEAGVRATFFILGWVAERHPAMARRIVADGHEVASHGSEHIRVDRQAPESFRADVHLASQAKFNWLRDRFAACPSF
jgi:Polysaccharide deacetylase